MENTSVIVLAAGASKRLGQPKQLLLVDGIPMIIHVIRKIIDAGFHQIMVVLGHDHAPIEQMIKELPVHHFVHQNWTEGMGSSLSAGLSEALKIWPQTNFLLISVCDQPNIPTQHFKRIRNELEIGKNEIIASGYQQTFGPPIACNRKHFHELTLLKGDQGAKSIFKKYLDEMKIIHCEEGGLDIDTPVDVLKID